MLFNSIDFAIFFPIVFTIYWLLRGTFRFQNILIVLASYVFYSWWDWRFLSLIVLSTILDYSIGILLGKVLKKGKRRALVWISITLNLSLLMFFKYHNFFVDNFISAFALFGTEFNKTTLNIVLPVGISFYTFQTMSYTIDIYRNKLQPTRDLSAFAAFVCFFPQLVAGPIERASNLLPQFLAKRKFDLTKAKDGTRQILWGLFKKVVIADSCAYYVNEIFMNSHLQSGSTLILGSVLFAFQIYGDFSGYSDIAIGASRLLGFDLMKNFNFPYFSRDIAEFWRRWHISLSTWFRDYLYIPLGDSRTNKAKAIRNTVIVFVVSGFWHGPNWTFVIWGALNALYFLPLLLLERNRQNMGPIASGRSLPSWSDLAKISFTFIITCVAWIFFRARSTEHAVGYLLGILDASTFSIPRGIPAFLILAVLFQVIVEWTQREKEHGMDFSEDQVPRVVRWIAYLGLSFVVAIFMGAENTFIYFQF